MHIPYTIGAGVPRHAQSHVTTRQHPMPAPQMPSNLSRKDIQRIVAEMLG